MNQEQLKMVVLCSDGTILSARMADGAQEVDPQKLSEMAQAVKNDGGFKGLTIIGRAVNEEDVPPPSRDNPWLPKKKKLKIPKPVIVHEQRAKRRKKGYYPS